MRYHETVVTVRFNEIDAYQVAWHGHYVAWMEIGRNELARLFGMAADQLAEAGFLGPVVALELKYLRPARFNDQLTVKTTVKRNETPTIEFRTVIIGQDGAPCARGVTVHALTDMQGVTQYRLPATVAERVEKMLAWAEGGE
ncbi:putative esterase [Geobacter sp. OR-1]|uniref:acyl-CoA thioesterase n=1 Tax=Geobacter sp. OR-1 TaxID=1266765 RepID=UPI000544142D|nr:acyl-CoA thioesterase [Geobacter sp. OR-1]GAM08863.1 putative esterase [Geobacter sp. OR-1]